SSLPTAPCCTPACISPAIWSSLKTAVGRRLRGLSCTCPTCSRFIRPTRKSTSSNCGKSSHDAGPLEFENENDYENENENDWPNAVSSLAGDCGGGDGAPGGVRVR